MRTHILSLVLLAGCGMEEPDDQLATLESRLTSGSRGDDIVVLGSSHPQVLVAFSKDYASVLDRGNFEVVAVPGSEAFASYARAPGVKRLRGDFNRDGRTDLALVGGPGWNTIPLALADGHGGFSFTNTDVGNSFNAWASTAGVKVLVGDYNRDGMADIALTGASGWATIPVAFSYGNGSFDVRNGTSGLAAITPGVPIERIHVGDYNKDGLSDIAVIGVGTTIFVAFAAYGGNWTFIPTSAGPFNGWVNTPNVKSVLGDFNRDGYSDIALLGGAGWSTVPVASSAGGGPFVITNRQIAMPSWPAFSASVGHKAYVAERNGDGYSDIYVTGAPNWGSMGTLVSLSGGEFENRVTGSQQVAQLAGYAPDVLPMTGDFDYDGITDFVMLWLGRTDIEAFHVSMGTNFPNWSDKTVMAPGFATFAGEAAAERFVGRFN